MPKINIATVIQQAAAKLDARDANAAEKLYRKALSLQPGNAAALLGLAIALNQMARYQESLPLLQKLVFAVEAGKLPLTGGTEATLYAQTGLAMQHTEGIAPALAWFRLAYNRVPSEELAAAIRHLEQAMIPRSPLEQLAHAARTAHRQGDFNAAVEAWRKVLQANPDHAGALFGLGMVLRDTGQSEQALPLVQQAIILQPDSAEYYNGLGMLFQDREDFQKAITFHQRALKLKPDFAGANCNIGVAYKRLGRNEDAIAAYRAALAIDPNMPEVYNNLGNLLRLTGDIAAARECLQKALALRPNYLDAQTNLDALGAASPTQAPPNATELASTPGKTASKPARAKLKKS